MAEIRLSLTGCATLVATKMGSAPVAALWDARIVTPENEERLGAATAAELRKLLLLRSPKDLELSPAHGDNPACAYVMMFYDELGPKTTLYAVPTAEGVELAWSTREQGKHVKNSLRRSGIVVLPAVTTNWELAIESAQDGDMPRRSELVF
jgi:hypothetical protein